MKSMCQEPRRNSPSVDDLQPDLLLQPDRVADRVVLDGPRARRPRACPAAASSRACSSAGGRSRLPTWSARNGGAVRTAIPVSLTAGRHGEVPSAPATRSAARSPIIVVGACVFPVEIDGITDASAIRRPSTPRTRSSGSTTASSSMPILQVQAWWKYVVTVRRM